MNIIQAAIDRGEKIIRIPEGVTAVDATIHVPSGTTIRGQGRNHSEVHIIGKFHGFDITDQSDVTFQGFAITYRAKRSDYNTGGGFAINCGTGLGASTKSKRNRFVHLWIHDVHKLAIACFGGCEEWLVSGCRIERTGRGGIVSNGFRRSRFIGNHFAETGDDALGLNGVSSGNTVVGNTFHRCGAWGVTPAAGLKIHGSSNTVSANTFTECFTAISIKEHPEINSNQSGFGASRSNLFAGNTIDGMPEKMEYTVGTGGNPAAIKVKNAYDSQFIGNHIYAVTASGEARPVLWLQNSSDVSFSDNTWIGSAVQVKGGGGQVCRDIRFNRDKFGNLTNGSDYTKNYQFAVGNGLTVENLAIVDCKFSRSLGCILRCFHDGQIDATIRGCTIGPSQRIGYIDGSLSGEIVEVKLRTGVEKYRGLMSVLKDGRRFYLCDKVGRHELFADRETKAGAKTIRVRPSTLNHQYKANESWIEWGESDAKAGKTNSLGFGSNKSQIRITVSGNNLPGFDDGKNVKVESA